MTKGEKIITAVMIAATLSIVLYFVFSFLRIMKTEEALTKREKERINEYTEICDNLFT